MKPRWRILIVLSESPARGARLASSANTDLPSLDVALLAAQLIRLGAEVRVMDQAAERISPRTVRREAAWWKPELTILHAGGEAADDDPVPDAAPLQELLGGRGLSGRLFAAGPLAEHYALELLDRFDALDGVLLGAPSAELLSDTPESAPGVQGRGQAPVSPHPLSEDLAAVLPAWHAFPLDAYPGRGGLRSARVAVSGADPERDLMEIRHAVLRAGARFLQFECRDVGAHPEGMQRVARAMFGAAPGVGWACRLRADHVEPAFALALARGGCHEVVLLSPEARSAPGLAPMDDAHRGRIESAVETLKATGVSVAVEFVIGRPGQDRAQLLAWQRWFADRQIAVRPQVFVMQGGMRGPGSPTLDEALERAGCWDNELRTVHIEKAVRGLGWHVGASSAAS
ncbi:MAG: hypothetical protein DHS20C15_21430 [Planctomycetota bacterium]|nr:MAG: hypothetical protein DHS20C15_21430 [Planctomycetota bacterium]